MARRQNFQYTLDEKFLGYCSKPDKTAAPRRILVSPSQNVLLNDEDKVVTRGGYTLDGSANAALNAVESGFTWRTSQGAERVLRGYDDELECRFVDAAGDVNYLRIADGWADVDFSFAPWWDTAENLEVLLFVVGNANIYEWGGGIAEVLSVTTNTITKRGTPTWAQSGFYTVANRTILINGVEYAYTGGTGTTTLTGVTPDPSAGGVVVGDFATQKIRTRSNEPSSSAINDAIGVLNNQLYVIDETSNEVSVSQDDDYTDFAFSSPRVPGEGELLLLDSPARAAIPLDQDMLIATIDDDWYRTKFNQITVSTTLSETLEVKKLRTGKGKGLQHRDLVANFGNAIVYLSNDNTLEAIERPQDLETIATQNLSDPIKPDFDTADFTNGHVFAHKNRVYVAAPVDGNVFIFELRQTDEGTVRFWHPPQVLPVRRFVTVSDDLYGHSSAVPETYKLFDGTDDNDRPFLARATISYNSYGQRALLKVLDEWFTEGYISSNAELNLTLNFDLDGSTSQRLCTIVGGDSNILFESLGSIALGDNPLGDEGLGVLDESSGLPKFRHTYPFPPKDFFEIQAIYEMDTQDGQFELLAVGGNVRASRRQPSFLKRQVTRVQ